MARAFLDTNILVYAADESAPVGRKTRIARELLRQRGLCLSVQVLNEFTVNARHPHKLNLPADRQREWVKQWLRLPVAPMTVETYLAACLIHARFQTSHWDSLILASAQEQGARLVYSEDFAHGTTYGGITVVNPFS